MPRTDAPSAGSTATRNEEPPQPASSQQSRVALLRGMVAPLRVRDYRLLFVGQLVSGIGDGFYIVALPWLVLTSFGGAQALGLVMGAYGVTRAATTVAGGWLSDRIGARQVMLWADIGRMALVAMLAVLSAHGTVGLGALCILAAALGIFSGAFFPASFAIIPDVLPAEALGAGNSLSFTYSSLAYLIGPALAGVVVARGNISLAFALDAATFLVSVLTLWAMRPVSTRRQGPTAEDGAANPAPEGTVSFWRFVLGSPFFQIVLVVVVVINLVLGGVIDVGVPALAHGPLHAGASGYGAMLAFWGGGALVGGVAGSLVSRLPRQGALNLAIWTCQGLAILAIPLSGVLAGALVAVTVMGLCNGVGNVTFMTVVQRQLPRELMGRMMGAIAFGNFGLNPLSVVIAGFAAARFGPGAVVAFGGALSALVMLCAAIPRAMRTL